MEEVEPCFDRHLAPLGEDPFTSAGRGGGPAVNGSVGSGHHKTRRVHVMWQGLLISPGIAH